MVARSVYAGAFLGSCDVASAKCTVSGLVPAMLYEIWLRTCSQTSAAIKNCYLRAQPISLATQAVRMFFKNMLLNDIGSTILIISKPRSAPTGVQLKSESTSAIKVSFPAPVAGSRVDSYQAGVKDRTQKCSSLASANPRECSLTSLGAGKQYTILIASSVGGEQSLPGEMMGYTLPEGIYHSALFEPSFSSILQVDIFCLQNQEMLKSWGHQRQL